MTDRAKLHQLLAIVLDNAVKYTGEGDRIDVRTVSDDRRVYIFVTDTGIGVTAEDAQNAFDRFYRANRARKAGDGRGLGLSIAKGIVEAHGGTIGAIQQRTAYLSQRRGIQNTSVCGRCRGYAQR